MMTTSGQNQSGEEFLQEEEKNDITLSRILNVGVVM
jgi:hypothetical protein